MGARRAGADPEDTHDWVALLARACRGDGVGSVYQPIVDVAKGVVAGYEALIRFDEGPADPELWFAAAHARGLGPELDAVALRSALRERPDLPGNAFLSVNVSPMSLTTSVLRSVWADQGPLGGIVVELTEQTPIDCYEFLGHDIRSLRQAGAVIAIDDAGAGYAGLKHLLAIRPEIVKLDRSLISAVDVDEGKRAMVEMMGTFTDRIDAWLLAEGVETVGELATVAELGVPLAQGFLLARPEPAWTGLDPDAAVRLISAAAHRARSSGLARLVQAAVTADTVEEARVLLGRGEGLVVLVDGCQRPVGMVTPDGGLIGQVDPAMRVNVDTPVEATTLRAITRDASVRFAPVVCTDPAGRYLGVVPMTRLIGALAAPTPAPTALTV